MADIEVREIEAVTVAALHREGSARKIGAAFGELYGALMQAQAPLAQGPAIGVYYGEAEAFDPEDASFDVCAPLQGDFEPPSGIEVRDLPAARMAVAVHKGPYDHMGPLYEEMFQWIGARGLTVAGPVRERYLNGPKPGSDLTPSDYLTEVQVPVTEA